MKQRYSAKVRIDEISAVDRPAQTPARAVLIKRADTEQPQGGAAADPSKGTETPSGDTLNKNTPMTPEQIAALQKAADEAKAQVEQLTKRAERAERLASLSDVQKQHLNTLSAEQQEAFLALEPQARETAVQAEVTKRTSENPVVETVDGVEIRKNDNPALVKMAKANKELRERTEKAEKAERLVKMQKRAGEELSNLPGVELAKVALLEACEALSADLQPQVAEILKAANSGLAKAFVAAGTREQPQPAGSGQEVFDTLMKGLVAELRKNDPKLSDAQAYAKALQTPEAEKAYNERGRK